MVVVLGPSLSFATPAPWQRATFWAEGKIEREQKKLKNRDSATPEKWGKNSRKLAATQESACFLLSLPYFSEVVESFLSAVFLYFALGPKPLSLPDRRGSNLSRGKLVWFRRLTYLMTGRPSSMEVLDLRLDLLFGHTSWLHHGNALCFVLFGCNARLLWLAVCSWKVLI